MKRKVIRAITGLLCAAMFFSNAAGMSVYAMEDGAGQEMQESISGNDDTGDAWEEPEEAEQESGDSDEEPGMISRHTTLSETASYILMMQALFMR